MNVTPKVATGSSRRSRCRWRRAIAAAWSDRPALRKGALAVAIAVYAVLSLEPFDWQLPRNQANHAERSSEGWRFPASGVVLAELPEDLLETAQRAEAVDVSVVARPYSSDQSGPARILTISRDTHLRNLTLGQEAAALVVRLRTEETDLNGLRAGEPVARVANVFRAGRWVEIDLRIRPRELAIAIDGERALVAPLPESVLATWQRSLSLALGNEPTCDRPWLGEIRKAVIEVSGETIDFARRDQVDVPPTCWMVGYPPALVPFRLFFPEDVVRNVLMYLPLGWLIGLSIRERTWRAFAGGVLAACAISAAFETAQLFVSSRFTSIDDVICNTVGGGLGLALSWWLVPSPRGTRRA